MSDQRERDQRFERHMSDAEALMWNVEKDPWLNPSGGMVTVLDRPIDIDQFRRRMRYAVSKIPRLRERVVPGVARLSPPRWETDSEFDFDYHVRHIALPAPGSAEQLFEVATRLYEDPFDRTRPLWIFVVVDGLADGRGGLFWKVHHTVSDGIGMVRLSELFMERERRTKLPPEVDLDELIATEVARASADGRVSDPALNRLTQVASDTIGHTMRRQLGIARRAADELTQTAREPERLVELGRGSLGAVDRVRSQLTGGGSDSGDSGSPLWAERSRRRHLEALRVPLADAKAAAHQLGGSINDFFIAGAVNGVLAYHAARGVEVESLNSSFVVSTRTDNDAGGNAFTPVRFSAPGAPMTPTERFVAVRDAMAEKRSEVSGGGMMASLAGVANLMPTSVITQSARSMAAHIDFATSNIRAAPFEMFLSGAKLLQNATMGPVAGTAMNLTTMSYNGSLDMGMFLDPIAIESPRELRDHLLDAYAELAAAGGVDVEWDRDDFDVLDG